MTSERRAGRAMKGMEVMDWLIAESRTLRARARETCALAQEARFRAQEAVWRTNAVRLACRQMRQQLAADRSAAAPRIRRVPADLS